MKKLLAFVLALTMVLSLAACDRDSSDPNNDKENARPSPTDQWVDLVTSYHAENSGYMAPYFEDYTLIFTYNDAYTGGEVEMMANSESYPGTFTCDRNYNINNITVSMEESDLVMDMTFDDHHRLLTAEITARGDGETELIYKLEQSYNNRGRVTRAYYEFPRFEQTSLTEYTFDDKGNLTGTSIHMVISGTDNDSIQKLVYEDGYMTAIEMYDGNGELLNSTPFSHEDLGDTVRYTGGDGYNDTVMIYDKQGNLLEQETYSDAQLVQLSEQTYDAHGNRLTHTMYNAATGQTTHIEFTYTASDRLISMVVSDNDQQTGCQETTFAKILIPID